VNTETPPLAERRAKLITLAAAQRRQLAPDIEPWRRPLAIADRGMAAARFVANHPAAWIAAAVIAPVAVRGTGLGKWLRRGLLALQVVRQLRGRDSRA